MTNLNRGWLLAVFRWAYANDWHTVYPKTRRDGQYTWTNRVPDPGDRRQSTLRVGLDAAGIVSVEQLMTQAGGTKGWMRIGWWRVDAWQPGIKVLAAMHVLPEMFLSAGGRLDPEVTR